MTFGILCKHLDPGNCLAGRRCGLGQRVRVDHTPEVQEAAGQLPYLQPGSLAHQASSLRYRRVLLRRSGSSRCAPGAGSLRLAISDDPSRGDIIEAVWRSALHSSVSVADIGLFKYTPGILADRIVYLLGTYTPQLSHALWNTRTSLGLLYRLANFVNGPSVSVSSLSSGKSLTRSDPCLDWSI